MRKVEGFTISGDTLYKLWSGGETVTIDEKKYSVHKMSYGDWFLEPFGVESRETDPFDPGTLWLEKIDPKENLYGLEGEEDKMGKVEGILRRKIKAMVIGYCPNCKKSTTLKVIDVDAMWNCKWQCQECGVTFTDEERKEQSKVKGVLRKSQKDLSGKEYEMVDLLRGVADELTANVAQIRDRGIRVVDPVYLEGCVRKLAEVIEYTKSLVGKPSVTGRKKRGQKGEVGDEVFGFCPECEKDNVLKIIDEDAISGESVFECQLCGEVFTEEERGFAKNRIEREKKSKEIKKVGKAEGILSRKIRTSATKWMGSTKCDICGRGFAEVGKVFYDGKTIKGSWAVMCRECFTEYGVGVGTGRGQMYDSKTLEKVGG